MIKERGISFELTAKVKERLRRARVDALVFQALEDAEIQYLKKRVEGARQRVEEQLRRIEQARRKEEEKRTAEEAAKKKELEELRRRQEEAKELAEARRKELEQAKRRGDEAARQAEAAKMQLEEARKREETKIKELDEFRKLEEEARKLEEARNRELEEARRREQEASQRAEGVRKKLEEVRKREEAERKEIEELKRREDEARRTEELRKKELEELRKREEEARKLAEARKRDLQARELAKKKTEDGEGVKTPVKPLLNATAPSCRAGAVLAFQWEDGTAFTKVAGKEGELCVLRRGQSSYYFDREWVLVKVAGKRETAFSRPRSPFIDEHVVGEKWMPFPVTLGQKWKRQFKAQSSAGRIVDAVSSFTVIAEEEIAVPAGTFRSFKIRQELATGKSGRGVRYFWYAPEIGYYVKTQKASTESSDGYWKNAPDYQLVAVVQPR
ncbi:MAG: hypothetical protein HY694_15140 [Deltaproteobacteria bacterium]|nr:hypothetical protein [Deltaproteobacteria bacterium]